MTSDRDVTGDRGTRDVASPEDDSLTPEMLEDLLEDAPEPPEAALHEVEPLSEALLDEGTDFEDLDDEEVEAAMTRVARIRRS